MNTTLVSLNVLILAIFFGMPPLFFEKVKPNKLYGFRTKATLRNKTFWFKFNKLFAMLVILSSMLFLISVVFILGWNGYGEDLNNLFIALFIIEIAIPVSITSLLLFIEKNK